MTPILDSQDMRVLSAAVAEDGKLAVTIDIGDNQILSGTFTIHDILRFPHREAAKSPGEPFLPNMPVPLSVTLRARCDYAIIASSDAWVTLGDAATRVLDGLRSQRGAASRAALPWIDT